VALLHQAVTLGAVVEEVPVNFIDRKLGTSKLGLRDIIEFVLNAWWIRMRAVRTFLRFALVGASGTLVNLGAFSLLLHTGMNKFVASPLAIEISIVWNFLLNNYWTFKERRTRDRAAIKGVKYNLISLVSLGVSFTTFILLNLLVPKIPPLLSQLAGIIPAVFVNYFLNSYWTFRHHASAPPQGEQAATATKAASHSVRP
jgi:dolichol-phosphate mannosyltransferase